MLGTFFFCRVAMFPYVCYMYSQVVGLPYWQVRLELDKAYLQFRYNHVRLVVIDHDGYAVVLNF